MINKTQIVIGLFLIVAAGIPASIFLSQQNQDTRSSASASTTLSFTPSATAEAPIEKDVGESVSFDVMVDPGNNLPSIIRLELQYDPTKFTAGTTPFVVNTPAFPTTIEGPLLQNGKVLIAVSIGSDATKAIQTKTKVGTLTLTTKDPTTDAFPTNITFGTKSQILSIGSDDQSTENVLATTIPAYVMIKAAPTPIQPTTTISPTMTSSPSPTLTLSPTSEPIPTATLTPLAATLSFQVYMHGIGNSGDNANPSAFDLSNKEPLHPSREVMVQVYNDQNQLIATKPGFITYDAAGGFFKGSVDIGNTVGLGDYTVRIKENTHLRRLVPGIQRITPQQDNQMPPVVLVAGDINNDNILNILDYNTIVGCYSDLLPAVDCDDARKIRSDLNDNGEVNQFDYNFFLREITVQSGN